MHKNWIIGILIGIIILVSSAWLLNFEEVGKYFTVLSSAVTIALALVAIFFAFKQDKESRHINVETSKMLGIMNEKLNNVSKRVESLDYNKTVAILEENLNEFKTEITQTLQDGSRDVNKDDLLKIIDEKLDEKHENINSELYSTIYKKTVLNKLAHFDKYNKKYQIQLNKYKKNDH